MAEEDWQNQAMRCFGLRLAGAGLDEVDEAGNPVVGANLLILLNAQYDPISFTLPGVPSEKPWELVLDTREATGKRSPANMSANEVYELETRSLALFCSDAGDKT